jgi:acetoin utilization protein AcuB
MIISDIMTANVISIPSDTSLAEARRVMDSHRIRRLPVIDGGKLVGVVTKDALDRKGPSQMTNFSVEEIVYLLNNTLVKEIMHRDVVTVSPTTTVEEAVELAQNKRVGILVVLEGDKVVGVATTNDFFYKILNPILGIKMPGTRIVIRNCNGGLDIEKIVSTINKLKVGITNLFIIDLPKAGKHDLVVHLDTKDCASCIEEIARLGCPVEERVR